MALRPAQDNGAARQYIYDNFGVLSYYIDHPEIGPILLDAGYNQWTPQRLQAVLMGTQWWQTHSDAQRQYDDLQKTDPSTLARMINERQATLYNMMRSMGASYGDIGALTRDAVRNGWSDEQVRDMLVDAQGFEATSRPGLIQTLYQQNKAMAAAYFIPVSDKTAFDLAKQTARGELDEQGMQALAQQWAMLRYSHLAEVIESGVTLQQYFDPHRNEIAKLLEISPDKVDFMNDPKWQKVVEQYDPELGKKRDMTLSEVGQYARSQEEWKKTDNAREFGASMTMELAKMFGQVG